MPGLFRHPPQPTQRVRRAPRFLVVQTHFRFRNDDGSETTATWKAAEDTNINQEVNTNFRLRFVLQESGGAAWNGGDGPEVHYRKNGGSWSSVGFGSQTEVKPSLSPNFTNADATTDQIGGTGTFDAGEMDEDNAYVGGTSSTIPASGHTEHEFCMQLVGTGVVNGDLIEFRLIEAVFNNVERWDVIPAITVGAAAEDIFPYVGGGYYG